jgi:hypothetical protein
MDESYRIGRLSPNNDRLSNTRVAIVVSDTNNLVIYTDQL